MKTITCKKCNHAYQGQEKCPNCYGIQKGKKVSMTLEPINKIDQKIGIIIKRRRNQLGLSQDAIGRAMGITFQQVQKYEKGRNAMNATRLVEMAKVLKMPVIAFFDDTPHSKSDASDRESLELMKAFERIKSAAVRKRISDLARAVAI
jgi:transcriptional regulator with XRE-family HTH domain